MNRGVSAESLKASSRFMVLFSPCEDVRRPDSLEFLPRDDLARMLQQHLQKMEGLLLELYLDALLAQLPGTQIHFEHAEANRPTRWMSTLHLGQPHQLAA